MSSPVKRVGGRVLLLDPDGRVLLIHERLDVDTTQAHWLTPGGGLEPGENPRRAAVREAYEETGIRVALRPEAPEVHRQRRVWSWDGASFDQTDHFFAASVAAGLHPTPVRPTEAERAALLGYRWWSAAELRASTERFEPPEIAELVERLTDRPAPTPRTAGRVLLLDGDGRVLLLRFRVDVGAVETHWITPGGGAGAGESPARAATRELYEEVGVRAELADGAAPVHVERKVFRFDGDDYDQRDEYYLHRIEGVTPLAPVALEPSERATYLGLRWWSADELRASAEVVHPHGLADLLDRLAR